MSPVHEAQRPGQTVVLGRTYEDARKMATTAEEFRGLPKPRIVSAYEIRSVYGMRVARAYITPDAQNAPQYGRALAEVRRAPLKTPGADDDVIYLKEGGQ